MRRGKHRYVSSLRSGGFGVRTLVEARYFLFSRPAVGSTRPILQAVPGLFPGANRPGRDLLPTSSAQIKNEYSYTSAVLLFLHGGDNEQFLT